jgi:hypothetical protein
MKITSVSRPNPESLESSIQLADRKPVPASLARTRLAFWALGFLLATAQIWVFRYQVSTDSISYLDMSDGALPGSDWHHLINGVWSPLYPFLLGMARRVFSVRAPNEIVAAHFMNLGFFLFAFLCFEFLLRNMFQELAVRDEVEVSEGALSQFPGWSYLIIAYSLFLWASIHEISVRNLRPDMLMSGFVYLAAGMLLRMRGCSARWKDYFALGLVLGLGILAKEPLLPLGVLIILASLLAVENWKPTLKMSAGALVLVFLVGGLYFAPLSRARGSFTLGQSGAFNYLVHVNHVRPEVYLQTPGNARGSFAHSPEKIFSSPPAYAFPATAQVTYPLRFDPADWIVGVHPRIELKGQAGMVWQNARDLAALHLQLCLVIAAVLVLACLSLAGIPGALLRAWPIWLIGLAGCAMYVPVHVEPRYVAGFAALFWMGIIFGFQMPRRFSRNWVMIGTLAISASLLFPVISLTYTRYFQLGRGPNVDAEAAAALGGMGIHPGDRVARISPLSYDIAMERIARVQISAEVDYEHAQEFWKSSPETQRQLLLTFASHGARAVIATSPELTLVTQAEWIRLGATQYWVWLPPLQY